MATQTLLTSMSPPPAYRMSGNGTRTLAQVAQLREELNQFQQEWRSDIQGQREHNSRMQVGVTARYTLLLVLMGLMHFAKPSGWQRAALIGTFAMAGLSVVYMDWLVFNKYRKQNQIQNQVQHDTEARMSFTG